MKSIRGEMGESRKNISIFFLNGSDFLMIIGTSIKKKIKNAKNDLWGGDFRR